MNVGEISIPTGLAFRSDSYSVLAEASADGVLEVLTTSAHAFSPAVCGETDTRWLGIYVAMVSAC